MIYYYWIIYILEINEFVRKDIKLMFDIFLMLGMMSYIACSCILSIREVEVGRLGI